MTALAVSVPGHPDRVCEDASGAHLVGDAIAVADGLGSAARAEEAAKAAVALALGPVREALQAGLAPSALPQWLATLWRDAPGIDDELATTLLFAVQCTAYTVVGQVGDGLVAVGKHDDLTQVASGRGAWGNQTEALPHDTVRVIVIPRDSTVLLATDGVSDDLRPGSEGPLAVQLTTLAVNHGKETAHDHIRAWLTDWKAPRSLDDRSIALLTRDAP